MKENQNLEINVHDCVHNNTNAEDRCSVCGLTAAEYFQRRKTGEKRAAQVAPRAAWIETPVACYLTGEVKP